MSDERMEAIVGVLQDDWRVEAKYPRSVAMQILVAIDAAAKAQADAV